MDEQMTVGTVVQLKSGGPLMTVSELKTGNAAQCEWFDGKTPKSGIFKLATLKVVPVERGAYREFVG